METLPDWWNDLIGWFLEADENHLPTNMLHAWRVNRFVDEVCNSGLLGYLADVDRGIPHHQLAESISIVCKPRHAKTLAKCLTLLSSQKQAILPDDAQIAESVAYDSLAKGATRDEALRAIAENCPDCPPQLHGAALEAAAQQLENERPWEDLNREFFDAEPEMRLCIASFAQRFMLEWRAVH